MIQEYIYPAIDSCYRIRDEVFTKEQGYPAEIDKDDYDKDSRHFVYIVDNKAVGTMRAYREDSYFKIGRVCILKKYRGNNYGYKMMEEAMKILGNIEFRLSSQVPAVKFYEKLGFKTTGEEYLEDGQPHIKMIKK